MTKHGRAVKRIVSTTTPPHLATLIANGTARPSEGPATCQSPSSPEAWARALRTTSRRVGADLCLDKAPWSSCCRGAGNEGGAGCLWRRRRRPNHRDRARRGNWSPGQERKAGRLTPAQLRRAIENLESLWRGVDSHAVNDALLAKAAESAALTRYALRRHGRFGCRRPLLRRRRRARVRLREQGAARGREKARLRAAPATTLIIAIESFRLKGGGAFARGARLRRWCDRDATRISASAELGTIGEDPTL